MRTKSTQIERFKRRMRGIKKGDQIFVLTMAVYNLVRMLNLGTSLSSGRIRVEKSLKISARDSKFAGNSESKRSLRRIGLLMTTSRFNQLVF